MIYDFYLAAIKACLIASLYPFCLLIKEKKIKIIFTVCFLIVSIFLQSRTLFFIVIAGFIYSEWELIKKKINKRIVIILCCVALLSFVFVNLNSLIGRLFIWKIIVSNLHTVPLLGLGNNTFKYYYATWQAKYFTLNITWNNYNFVADAPSFAFNEILHIYIEHGIAATFFL